ncbi:hypothetical protein NDU88_004641 [Pleurodeles waltl]|uniref:Uncharacterized protein n=1 Tax=Pleurodeles waltl TaxID=8319 RepID=A0AAV7W797_PLEWA|nr:hypothetical protein NDU88_004641 [Pleurodeles waltl]
MLVKPSQGLEDPVPDTFPLGGLEDEAQDGDSHSGAAELAREASSQPSGVDSQARAICGAVVWRKGVLTPGPGGGLVRAHEPCHAGEASLGPTGPRLGHLATQRAGGRSPGLGTPIPWPPGPQARPGVLNSNRQGKPPWAQWTPRPMPLRVRQAGGREHLPQGLVGARS